jgi:tetratricopeptide (TPR) repeat protein
MSAIDRIGQFIKQHTIGSMLGLGLAVAAAIATGPDFCAAVGLPSSLFPATGRIIAIAYLELLFFVWLFGPPRTRKSRVARFIEDLRQRAGRHRRPILGVTASTTAIGAAAVILTAVGVLPRFGTDATRLLESGTPGQINTLVQPECADSTRSVSNLLAYGKAYFEKNTETDLRRAIGCYEHALRQNPASALAHARIAQAWSHLADEWVSPVIAYPKAKAAAEQAVRLNPHSAEAHTELGKVLLYHDWNFAQAERHFRRAIELNPTYGDAHARLSDVLFVTGRGAEGLASVARARRLDPLSAPTSYFYYLMSNGQQARAISELDREHSEEFPSATALRLKGDALVALGRHEDALAIYQEAATVDGSMLATRARIARVHAHTGRGRVAREFLNQVKAEAAERYVRAEQLSLVYLAMGDTTGSITMLEHAYRNNSAGMRWLLLDPGYRPLHQHPQFKRLVKQVGVK